MRLDSLIIGMVLFSLVIISSTFIINDFNNNYDLNLDTGEFSELINTTGQIYNYTSEAGPDLLIGSDLDTGDDSSGTEDGLFKSGFKTIKRFSDILGLPYILMNQISKTFGIPFYIVDAFAAIIGVVLLFSIIYLLFRFIPR